MTKQTELAEKMQQLLERIITNPVYVPDTKDTFILSNAREALLLSEQENERLQKIIDTQIPKSKWKRLKAQGVIK